MTSVHGLTNAERLAPAAPDARSTTASGTNNHGMRAGTTMSGTTLRHHGTRHRCQCVSGSAGRPRVNALDIVPWAPCGGAVQGTAADDHLAGIARHVQAGKLGRCC
jgi:hypothetical protein